MNSRRDVFPLDGNEEKYLNSFTERSVKHSTIDEDEEGEKSRESFHVTSLSNFFQFVSFTCMFLLQTVKLEAYILPYCFLPLIQV